MNDPHQNARLTVNGREQIVARIGAGQRAAEAAAAFGVSVRKWVARFKVGGRAALSNRACPPPEPPAGSGRHGDRLDAAPAAPGLCRGSVRPRVSELLCMTDPVHASPKGSMNDHLERNPG